MGNFSLYPEVTSANPGDYLLLDVTPITPTSTSKITKANLVTSIASTITGIPESSILNLVSDLSTHTANIATNASAITTETTARTVADSLLMVKTANLSDVTNTTTARANLGVPAGSGNSTGTNTGDQSFAGLQATLVSGTNIKTINSASVLGSGDLVVTGASDPLKANLASPAFTGTPTAPTAAPGANSTQVATTAYADAGSPTATFTTAGKVKQTEYNVRDYGAVGDGTTDDTTAIQNTINAAHAAGVGRIRFTGLIYKITSTLTVYSDLTFLGDNQDKTQVRQSSTTADCFSGVDLNYVTFKDIQVFGPGSGSGIGIHLTLSSNASTGKLHLENVVAYNFGSDGINIANPILSTFTNVSTISNKGHGFNMVGGTSGAVGTSVATSGCYALSNVQAGYRFYMMAYSSLSGCAAEGNGLNYLIDSCQSLSLVAPGSESPVNNSASYPGISFKITNSLNIGLYNPWMYKTVGVGVLVTGNSTAQVFGLTENSPTGSATTSIQVDTGSKATVTDPIVITPTSFAANTTTILHDQGGNATFGKDLSMYGSMTMHPTSNPAMTFKSVDDSNYLLFYHTGTGGYGQIESSTGFVLFSDSGQTTFIGSNNVQARVQHNGGSYSEMNFGHDDTNGTIGTNAGNIILAPAGDGVDVSAKNIITDTTTGTKIGTATTQKLSHYGATPIIQPVATTDLGTVLSNLGLRAAGTAWPLTTTGAITSGSHTLSPAGAKLNITTGSNASAGTGTLVGGTVTISTTAVTASSLIFVTDTATTLTNVGSLSANTIVAGTSFKVTSTNVLDTSGFSWFIIN